MDSKKKQKKNQAFFLIAIIVTVTCDCTDQLLRQDRGQRGWLSEMLSREQRKGAVESDWRTKEGLLSC